MTLKILATLLLMTTSALAAPICSPEYTGISCAKYLFRLSGQPVWSDGEKAEILLKASRSSYTVTEADFIPIYPDNTDVTVATLTIGNLTSRDMTLERWTQIQEDVDKVETELYALAFQLHLIGVLESNGASTPRMKSELLNRVEFLERKRKKLDSK